MSVLAAEGLQARHGLLTAVRDVDLRVDEGATLGLVGANGAGKTTLLRTLAGAHRPAAGRVLLDGEDVTALPAHLRVRRGVVLVPEGRRLFPDLTVLENLQLGATSGRSGGWTLDTVVDAFPLLGDRLQQRAANLSGGEQQATAIGRALMANPRVLLLDEVSLGLAPIVVDAVYRSLRAVIDGGATVLLVEQDLARALDVASNIACMLEGRIVLDGPRGTLTRERVVEAFFGLGRRGGDA